MKLGVVNASSKTALTVLRSYLAKSGVEYSQIYLMDLYPNYGSYQKVYSFVEGTGKPELFKTEKMYQKYYMKRVTDQCDGLLYFTHDYYLNVTCKNQSLKNFSELLDPSSQQTVDIINLAENAQTIEGDSYFANAVSLEQEFGQAHKGARFYWADFVYGGQTEFTDFIKAKGKLPHTGKSYRFVHADRISEAVLSNKASNADGQHFYVESNVQKADSELVQVGGSYGLNLNENLLSQTFTDINNRQNYRLWSNPPNLDNHLTSYKRINSDNANEEFSIDSHHQTDAEANLKTGAV